MRILLDTHAFLWLIGDHPSLSRKAKRVFEDEDNSFLLSLGSVWELAIKVSLGKLAVTKPLQPFLADQLAKNAIESFEIAFRHVCRVEALPFHHRDPYDRLLAAQCLEDELPILSIDPVFDRYGVRRIW